MVYVFGGVDYYGVVNFVFFYVFVWCCFFDVYFDDVVNVGIMMF